MSKPPTKVFYGSLRDKTLIYNYLKSLTHAKYKRSWDGPPFID